MSMVLDLFWQAEGVLGATGVDSPLVLSFAGEKMAACSYGWRAFARFWV